MIRSFQVEGPLGKVIFFTKLAETERTEREYIWGLRLLARPKPSADVAGLVIVTYFTY
ncbi:hypothetical protein GCM10011351_08170 [Paraliobacillus quinghaiensis]|uniref:Uncharacterized protein n=1 Tax=Paraliobacillus quinghaiensis TaxID=470815 RepID=A0A917WRA1_9BACI|nr:hypothetical protein GCM10011351_08170 [Paraliobacillus quinghaiensis]